MVFPVLLALHVAAGAVALITAFLSTLSKWIDLSHLWHVRVGRTFFWSMNVVALTAVPMTYFHPNTFLFLVALFSFYLAVAGWRYAKNRKGTPTRLDWISAISMLLVSVGMIGYAVTLYVQGRTGGSITLAVFGIIGGLLSFFDLKRLRSGGVKGTRRIAAHLTMMLSATIAALTAFLVNVVTLSPGFIVWLLPTVVITPVIIIWNRQLFAGKQVTGAS